MQYPTAPTCMDFGAYTTPSPNVEWARGTFAGPYPSYTEDETSPYSSQPPPYILPNTDPMSASAGYYIHTQGVRPSPSSLWPDQQHCIPQQSSQLSNPAYTGPTDASQPFQTIGICSGPPPERILPTPIIARNYFSTQIPAIDNIAVPTHGQRNAVGWNTDTTTPAQQNPTQMDGSDAREQASERRNTGYRIQELPYDHMSLNESLAANSVPTLLPLVVSEVHSSPQEVTPEETQQQCPGMGMASGESLKPNPESISVVYGYTGSVGGRISQLRSASGQLSNGALYCRTQNLVSRTERAPEDCSPDCSNCPTDSTRTSVVSMSTSSSGY